MNEKKLRGVLALCAGIVALAACAPNPEGGLYALNCTVESASDTISETHGYESRTDIFGVRPGLIVFDEERGKLFHVLANIDGPVLKDSCASLGLCNLPFDDEGFRFHINNRFETAHFIYDRSKMSLSLGSVYKSRIPNPPPLSIRWTCTSTDFPERLWNATQRS